MSKRGFSLWGKVKKIQSNLNYPDLLGPHELIRIIKGPDNRGSTVGWKCVTVYW